MVDSEKKLVENAKKGEAGAFGALYECYLTPIYRFVFLKTGDKEISEDIVHQVFLNAWQNIRRYEDRGFPFSSWLYRIARNALIDHYRAKRDFLNVEDVVEEVADPADFKEDLSVAAEAAAVKECIKLLDPNQQDVLIMRFVEELSCLEIAEIMNKSEGAVRVLQHRALKSLRLLIKRNEKKSK